MARSKVRVEVDSGAVSDLLKSSEILGAVDAPARRIAAAAGPGFEASSRIGRRRALAMVHAETWEARRREATDRALTRALDAGRG